MKAPTLSGIDIKRAPATAIAILSLAIAVVTLAYTTWRNETTENHRNVRTAGFQILLDLGSLQVLADRAQYRKGDSRGDPIEGWGLVNQVDDLSVFMGPEVQRDAAALKAVWTIDWEQLGEDDDAASRRVSIAIGVVRATVRRELAALQ